MKKEHTLSGATLMEDFVRFRVWAPGTEELSVVLEDGREQGMDAIPDGYWQACVETVGEGDLYRFRVDGRGPFPDPASRFQPLGVHGPSAVIDPHKYQWTDHDWRGIALEDAVIYELHVGTFTPEGTFSAASAKLAYLADLGVTAVELMPVADFPGNRNWGYDGVALFAPARCYGTPDELRDLVNRAHGLGLAVFLDVVYNHFGPDGAYQGAYTRQFFSTSHRSPWGEGLNFDGPSSAAVRDYFAGNAVRWIQEYHLDGLRLDATHAIIDDSPKHFLAYLSQTVREATEGQLRRVHLIAEDHRNLAKMVQPEAAGGWGLDGVWADDFHHQIRRKLAGDHDGYFEDFDGTTESIAETARQGWFYSGQHAPHFGGLRGSNPAGLVYSRFVICLQNHDQIGNRAFGDRLHHSVDLSAYRAASTLLLLLPETPLLFMGQEWAASSPFQFFTDHKEDLGQLVTAGRRREFGSFQAFADPVQQARIPDPQAPATFERSRLLWAEQDEEPHASVLRMYRSLLALRRTEPSLRSPGASPELIIEAQDDSVVWLRREGGDERLFAVVCLHGDGAIEVPEWAVAGSSPEAPWELIWSTEDPSFAAGPRTPRVALPFIEFGRPGAVIFRSGRKEQV